MTYPLITLDEIAATVVRCPGTTDNRRSGASTMEKWVIHTSSCEKEELGAEPLEQEGSKGRWLLSEKDGNRIE